MMRKAMVGVMIWAFVLLSASTAWGHGCTHPIYCTGPLLDAVERQAIFSDSKTFVDMPLLQPVETVLAAFNALPAGTNLTNFVNEYFAPAGADLIAANPPDWTPNPPFFKYITDPRVLNLSGEINLQWLNLIRIFNDSFGPNLTSHISVPNPFVIAGSRFREFYYWDTYWSLDGLLISNMLQSAYGMVMNFLGLIQQLGFIPNGGRIYYLNRSQPPLVTQMVRLYQSFAQNATLLQYALPILDIEYQFWMTEHAVQLDSSSVLNRYYVVNSAPRPESYLEDVTTTEGLDASDAANVYQQLASTAESGWDFSTRWMSQTNPPSLTSLWTTDIIPVDLNCILYANEQTLADLHQQNNDTAIAATYRAAAAARLAAIQKYLWNATSLSWNDYNTRTQSQTVGYYAAQFVPFWSGVYRALTPHVISQVVTGLLPIFNYSAGLPASLQNSGQQWDFPNGWAPMQYWAVQGFRTLIADPYWEDPVLTAQLTNLTNNLVRDWITTNYCVIQKFGLIFEKYDVRTLGTYGQGGEYTVQNGFGWTNGVALRFIADYAGVLTLEDCPVVPSSSDASTAQISIWVVVASVLLLIFGFM